MPDRGEITVQCLRCWKNVPISLTVTVTGRDRAAAAGNLRYAASVTPDLEAARDHIDACYGPAPVEVSA